MPVFGLARCGAPSGALDELTASDKLEALRRETGEFKDLSFDTISGAGSNGAIVHYRVMPETNKKLEPVRFTSSIPARSTRTAPPT